MLVTESSHGRSENSRVVLPSGPADALPALNPVNPAPTSSFTFEFLAEGESFDPERVAYKLVRELYLWFGWSDEDIPYTKVEANGESKIGIEKIKSIVR